MHLTRHAQTATPPPLSRARPRATPSRAWFIAQSLVASALLTATCAPATPPSPTLATPKPVATEAPRPAPQPTVAPVAPTAAPAAAPTKPAEAKPAATAAPTAAFDEKAVAEFYRGKTIRIIAPTTPGGAIDLVSRLVAKYLGQYIPGAPNTIVENRAGAGGAVAANLVYNTEPKDGTVIITPQEGLVLQQALGAPGIEFDATRWNWLGSTLRTVGSCIIRTDAQARSIQDAMAGKEVIMGVSSPGGTTYDLAAVLKAALGANFRLVPGYPAAAELQLALERKETEAFCVSVHAMLQQAEPLLEGSTPQAKFLVLMGSEPFDHPYTRGVPPAETLTRNEESLALLRAINAPQQMNKPWAVAPGVPADRVAALRAAFARLFADPRFIEDMKAAKQELKPNTPEEVTRLANQVLNTPKPVVEKLKEILKK